MVSKDRKLADFNQMNEYIAWKKSVSDQLSKLTMQDNEKKYSSAVYKSLEVLGMKKEHPLQLPDKDKQPEILLAAAASFSNLGKLDDTIELYRAAVGILNELNGIVGKP